MLVKCSKQVGFELTQAKGSSLAGASGDGQKVNKACLPRAVAVNTA